MNRVFPPNNITYMELALEQAALALPEDVPVGAVLVDGASGLVLAKQANTRERNLCLSQHAELLCLEEAAQKLGHWRLPGCSLYVTLEPCLMCSGAILEAQLGFVYYGASAIHGRGLSSFAGDFGALQVYGGLLGDECFALLRSFFQSKRRGI